MSYTHGGYGIPELTYEDQDYYYEDPYEITEDDKAATWDEMTPASKTAFVLDWILNKVIMILCILLFLMCAYAAYDSYLVFNKAGDDSLLQYKPKQSIEETKKVLGEDCVAWLTIDNTTIDYPVMQGADDNTYLNTDPYGNYSLSGSIFLDSQNSSDFTDDYNIVYGHHMDGGVMFGALDDFLQKSYFDSHLKGTLITESGTYEITLFAATATDAHQTEVFTANNSKINDWLKENADIYETPANNHILAMTTCSEGGSTARTAVFGYLNLKGDGSSLQDIQDEKTEEEVKTQEDKLNKRNNAVASTSHSMPSSDDITFTAENTADSSHIGLYTVLVCTVTALIVVLIVIKKHKNKKGKAGTWQ